MSAFGQSKIWKFVQKREKLYRFYKRTLGRLVTRIRLHDRIKDIQKNGISLIMEIEHELENTHAEFFVDCGTLLGLVRDNGLIKWDFDIDFGIFISEKFGWDDLQSAMRKIGYSLCHQFRYKGNVTEQTYRKEDSFIDFFGHFQEEDHTCFFSYYSKVNFEYSSNDQRHVLLYKTVKLTGTKKINFDGGYVHIPKEAEKYLEGLYGKTWRMPDPNWVSGSGPACIHLDDYCIAQYEQILSN